MNIFLNDAEEVLAIAEEGVAYVLTSDSEEVIFVIEENYVVHNTMGSGQWKGETLEESIAVIEKTYNDTVIDRTKNQVLHQNKRV